MPVCVHCAYPTQHVYTTYSTKSNIRLGVCERCNQFIDPLIEHPPLLLLLDLILLKPRVYLHILFNRGSPPRHAEPTANDIDKTDHRYEVLRGYLIRLSLLTLVTETILRVRSPTIQLAENPWHLARAVMESGIELVTQYLVTTFLGLGWLWWVGWWPQHRRQGKLRDGRQENFIPILIPLTLLITSILPLLLQLILSIWSTSSPTSTLITPSQLSATDLHTVDTPFPLHSSLTILPASLLSFIPPRHLETAGNVETALWEIWTKSDRIWAGTRLLGGMSSGFGLRVLLPTSPRMTTLLVLSGWICGTFAGQMVGSLLDSKLRLF
ncbi:hypothetical protein TREMEDRAFT_67728 [Tremella mesenterica DSM 1558]|uniref:uncharacterized protein n=1 Tax=Tremella mesenterica (strain ATCC 24925 / CBS 8224 / DSM 1558 / NBRC 9311 / NRRL Y-6157 / RJB 2259-6 / UBC 559-6) TaxID=578456 RepID=UPI0003F49BE3|nr:uncharacterized protein TREMEDRAFT_67728 [Tremella mesenterica DSM 1558]EIW71372.1 hypothetical protein TREMEDRAFT_67728 [Tremella mesenterica DSM 1558]